MPKGTLLLSVPEACCISADEDPQWGLSLRELTTARLVGSRTRGEHEPYIATLPIDEPLLCDWSDAELAELQDERLVRRVRARRASDLGDERIDRANPEGGRARDGWISSRTDLVF